MQSRRSIATFCLAACLGFVGSIAAQEAAVAPSGDCGSGQQGGYAVEGCLKGLEIRQNDAEGLWNGYCEGDCRTGHSKERGCGGKRCGQSGCQSCFGFSGGASNSSCSDCNKGFGGGLRSANLRNGSGFGGRSDSHSAGCGCDACSSGSRASLFSGRGTGNSGGLFGGKCGGDSCATNAAGCDTCDQGPTMPASADCGSCGTRCRNGLSINLGFGRSANNSSNCSCGTSCSRPGLLSGLGNCGCGGGHGNGLGLGSRSSCGCGGNASDCSSCSDGCSVGSGHYHGFGLRKGNGCGRGNWDNMCGKNYFSAAGGDCGCSK